MATVSQMVFKRADGRRHLTFETEVTPFFQSSHLFVNHKMNGQCIFVGDLPAGSTDYRKVNPVLRR